MLEVAILTCVAAIFIILVYRFPKTKKDTPDTKNFADDILGAKDILEVNSLEDNSAKSIKSIDELDRYEKDLSLLLKSAREKIADGKYASAEGLLIEAICKDRHCAWAYERLGSIYLAMGKNLSDAFESFEVAVKIDKNNDAAWFGLGEIYLGEAKFNKAINCYSKAVNISRSEASYQAALGQAYMEVRQYGKASKALKRASQLDISNEKYKELASLAEDKHREHSRASKLS